MRKIIFLLVLIFSKNFVFAEGAWERAIVPIFTYPREAIPFRGYGNDVNHKLYVIDLDIAEKRYGHIFEFKQNFPQFHAIIQLNIEYEIIGRWEGGMGANEFIKVLFWKKEEPDKKYGVICPKNDDTKKVVGIIVYYVYRSSERVMQRHGDLLTEDYIENIGGSEFLGYYRNPY
jgi:hypothetical protein